MTPKQQEVLNFVRRFYDREKRGPSIRQIAAACTNNNPGESHRVLRCLVELGELAQIAERSHGGYVPAEYALDRVIRKIPTELLQAELARRETAHA